MGDRLKEARVAAGFQSATRAAESLGTKDSTYRAHENGQNEYSVDDARRYARKFKVSPIWLMFGHSPETSTGVEVEPSSLRGSSIPEIDVRAGMGGGGVAILENRSSNGITFASESVRAEWVLPHWVEESLGVPIRHVACFPCRGDSMSPTINDGDVVFVDTSHRHPSPDGVYALLDDFGGLVIKRLQVISSRSDEQVMVRVISDNENHTNLDRTIDEISIVGRYLRKFTR